MKSALMDTVSFTHPSRRPFARMKSWTLKGKAFAQSSALMPFPH